MNPVEALREIGFLLERSRADTYRVRAYRGAADVVAAMSEEQRAEHQRERSWAKVPGVGPKTATVITQALAGEVPDYLQKLRDEKAAAGRGRPWRCGPRSGGTCTATRPGPTAAVRWRR